MASGSIRPTDGQKKSCNHEWDPPCRVARRRSNEAIIKSNPIFSKVTAIILWKLESSSFLSIGYKYKPLRFRKTNLLDRRGLFFVSKTMFPMPNPMRLTGVLAGHPHTDSGRLWINAHPLWMDKRKSERGDKRPADKEILNEVSGYLTYPSGNRRFWRRHLCLVWR